VHGKLVAQGEVLKGELAAAAAEEGEETKRRVYRNPPEIYLAGSSGDTSAISLK